MQYYAVFRVEKASDRLIARRVNRRAAVRLAARLNAVPGAPLHYALWWPDARGALPRSQRSQRVEHVAGDDAGQRVEHVAGDDAGQRVEHVAGDDGEGGGP